MSDKPEINEAGRAGGLAVSPFSSSYFDAERLALLEAGARVLGNAECRRLADEIRGNQNMPPMNMPNVPASSAHTKADKLSDHE